MNPYVFGYPQLPGSSEFPAEFLRQPIVQTGSVKHLKSKFDKPGSGSQSKPGSAKPGKGKKGGGVTAPMEVPSGGFSATAPCDPMDPISGVMTIGAKPQAGPSAKPPPSADVVAAAKERMMDIARRHQQETTRKQSLEKLVENEKRRRRGGERGDVVHLEKKEREPIT